MRKKLKNIEIAKILVVIFPFLYPHFSQHAFSFEISSVTIYAQFREINYDHEN